VNILEPWILLRLVAGLVASVLFLRGAITSWRVLRHFDVSRASEGQLALERQFELASTFVRIATVVQVSALVLTVLAADRLSRAVRGAMCAYGVFSGSEWGFRALGATLAVALASGVLSQIYAFDARVRAMDLVRSLALATMIVAPFAILDLVLTALFLLKLDLKVVASCCSVSLDSDATAPVEFVAGPRALTAIGAPIAILLSIAAGYLASRRPRAPTVALAGAMSIVALPLALGAAAFDVAPHAFEIPQHVCPFCLLRADVFGIGYPLFAAILLAVVWGAGAGLGGVLAKGPAAREAFGEFARSRLTRAAVAWFVALLVGVAPIVHYALVSGGATLFR
jgi:hypothetical protein